MKLLRKGKVKDIYELADRQLVFHFSDRVSAFDIKMDTPIPRKGEVLCKFAEFWFMSLGIKHHMVNILDKDKMVVRKLSMIPMECVVRGYFYGSIVERLKEGDIPPISKNIEPELAAKFPMPLFDPTTKSEEHDKPVTREQLISSGVISEYEYQYLKKISTSLYERMAEIASTGGFILADVKFEFGRNDLGEIVLADSLGPDEYRLWLASNYESGKIQESYDKQLLRDWLIKIGFKHEVEMLAKQGRKPIAPHIPTKVVDELSRRYIIAYEKITRRKL